MVPRELIAAGLQRAENVSLIAPPGWGFIIIIFLSLTQMDVKLSGDAERMHKTGDVR